MTKYNKIKILIFVLIATTLITIAVLYFNPKLAVIRTAKKFLGEEENPNNNGFKNSGFETEMESVGYSRGSQWCAYGIKLVFTKALSGKRKKLAEKLISGSSQLTWANFKGDKSGLFEISDKPGKGSIVVWQSFTDPSKGHVGIVISHNKDFFKTIEFNSNDIVVNLRDLRKNIKKDKDLEIETQKSEGKVAIHIRKYDETGMKRLGFINFT